MGTHCAHDRLDRASWVEEEEGPYMCDGDRQSSNGVLLYSHNATCLANRSALVRGSTGVPNTDANNTRAHTAANEGSRASITEGKKGVQLKLRFPCLVFSSLWTLTLVGSWRLAGPFNCRGQKRTANEQRQRALPYSKPRIRSVT